MTKFFKELIKDIFQQRYTFNDISKDIYKKLLIKFKFKKI